MKVEKITAADVQHGISRVTLVITTEDSVTSISSKQNFPKLRKMLSKKMMIAKMEMCCSQMITTTMIKNLFLAYHKMSEL